MAWPAHAQRSPRTRGPLNRARSRLMLSYCLMIWNYCLTNFVNDVFETGTEFVNRVGVTLKPPRRGPSTKHNKNSSKL